MTLIVVFQKRHPPTHVQDNIPWESGADGSVVFTYNSSWPTNISDPELRNSIVMIPAIRFVNN